MTGRRASTFIIKGLSDEQILAALKKGATVSTKSDVEPYQGHKIWNDNPQLIAREVKREKIGTSGDISYSSQPEEQLVSLLYLKHVYYFDKLENNKISLKNPHGNYHLLLDVNEFKHYFHQINIANIPK